MASDSIGAMFSDLGVDIAPELEQCGEALTEALRAAKRVLADAGDPVGE